MRVQDTRPLPLRQAQDMLRRGDDVKIPARA